MRFDAEGVPHLERAKLPGEAPAHGAIHVGDGIGNFGNAARGIETGFGNQRPEELLGLVAGLAGEHRARAAPGGVRECLRCARAVSREAKRAFWLRAILHGGGIERQDFAVAAFLDALVKAAAGLFAEPAATYHLLDAAAACGRVRATRRRGRCRKYCARRGPARRGRQCRRCGTWRTCGQPMAGPVQASTSSMVMPSWVIRRIAVSMENVPMRLAMKLGVSLARTTPLPRRRSQKSAERIEHFGPRGPGRESVRPASCNAAD